MEKRKSVEILIFISLFAAFLLTISNLYIFLKVIPEYKGVYASVGLDLPCLTQVCILLSDSVRCWFILLLPILCICFIACITLAFVVKKRTLIAAIYSIITSLLIILILLSCFAMELPMISINKILLK